MNKKNKNKLYNRKTFIKNNNQLIKLDRKNISPLKLKKYSNNSYNLENETTRYVYINPKKQLITTNSNYDEIEINLENLIFLIIHEEIQN